MELPAQTKLGVPAKRERKSDFRKRLKGATVYYDIRDINLAPEGRLRIKWAGADPFNETPKPFWVR